MPLQLAGSRMIRRLNSRHRRSVRLLENDHREIWRGSRQVPIRQHDVCNLYIARGNPQVLRYVCRRNAEELHDVAQIYTVYTRHERVMLQLWSRAAGVTVL